MADLVDVSVNLADVDKGMRAMSENADELGRVMRALKPFARRDQEDHAAKTAGSTGPWPARSPATIARLQERSSVVIVKTQTTRKKRTSGATFSAGAKIVTRRRADQPLGIITKSIRLRARQDELIGDSPVAWAGAHNKGPTTVGRGSVVPQREFLWWSPEFVQLAVNAIEDYVVAPWSKGATAFRIRVGVRPGV